MISRSEIETKQQSKNSHRGTTIPLIGGSQHCPRQKISGRQHDLGR